MRRFFKIGTLLLLLVSCLVPAMACAFPDAHMTPQERACCRMMKNDCGQAKMPASHGCCHKLPSSVDFQAIQAKPTGIHPITLAAVWLAAVEFSYPSLVPNEWMRRTDQAAPESPPPNITVLRI
jgi:hypothetical protein